MVVVGIATFVKIITILQALTLPSADAFATAGGTISATVINTNHPYVSPGLAMRNSIAAQLSRSPSDSRDTLTSASHISNKITTSIGKTASTVVSVAFFILLAYQRDAVVLTLWIGAILNAVFGKVLKKLLNHERPTALQNNDRVRLKPSDGGMPSSHAMSMGFIGTAMVAGVVPVEHRLVAGLALAAYAAIALRYRVRDHLHTSEQVAVGTVLGVGNAVAWLKYGVGDGSVGAPLSWVRDHCVSSETGLFPYSALLIPIVVGVLVVGSVERRITSWVQSRGKDE